MPAWNRFRQIFRVQGPAALSMRLTAVKAWAKLRLFRQR